MHCYQRCDVGEEAASMEKALGIRVVRHITKKPAGDAVDLEKHFRCPIKLLHDDVADDIACIKILTYAT